MYNLIVFILIGVFLDVLIFHHFRKDGDVFDRMRKSPIAKYIDCCLCHGLTIGVVLSPLEFLKFDQVPLIVSVLIGGAIISISALTYRILVLKE